MKPALTEMSCYMCEQPAVTVEHAPAKCFFPKGYRKDLITVPSCAIHNNDTSKDDEFVRGIIVSCSGNNSLALAHWRGSVRSGYFHSPKLFLATFSKQKDGTLFHDRKRVDNVIIKIAYALYFKEYKKRWESYPTPFYHNFLFDDGKTDIHERLPNYKDIPEWHLFEGSNQSVFKYQFFDGKVNGYSNCILRMVFYEGFEVIIIPRSEKLELDYNFT